jgi:hypothetical protein
MSQRKKSEMRIDEEGEEEEEEEGDCEDQRTRWG